MIVVTFTIVASMVWDYNNYGKNIKSELIM
jgi:hypothetical protein